MLHRKLNSPFSQDVIDSNCKIPLPRDQLKPPTNDGKTTRDGVTWKAKQLNILNLDSPMLNSNYLNKPVKIVSPKIHAAIVFRPEEFDTLNSGKKYDITEESDEEVIV